MSMKQVKRESAALVAIAVVLFGLVGMAQATVTAVGTDTTTGPNWRTAAALESDNQYGTDGYVIYGIDEADGVFANPYAFDQDQTVLPAGVTGIVTTAVQMWSGDGNFGTMEDPGNGNTIENAALAVLLGNTSSTFTISRTSGTSFRLTLLNASGDGADATYNTSVHDGSGAVPQSSTHTADGLHYHVFDISSGSSDVVATVSAGNHFSLTGLAFDNAETADDDGLTLASLASGGIDTNSATLSATLGGKNANVTVYWEAGTVADPAVHIGWDGTNGPAAETPGTIQRVAAGLTAGTSYSYAFFATNGPLATSVWSSVETFTTPLSLSDGQLSYTGTQFSVGSAWRTLSLAKPFDLDEDNVLGSDGYYVIGNNQRTNQPAYVASWSQPTSTYGGSSGYAYIDDPAVVPPGTATIYSGTANPSGSDVLIFSFVLGATAPEHFRLGMMMDGVDNASYNPDSVQLKVIGGGGLQTAVISTTGASYNDSNPDWLFFDVINFSAGSEIGVYSSGGFNTLQAFAFDRAANPLLPVVDNADGATNVLATSAWLTGNLVSTGGAPTRVWICWGETDEEQEFAEWGHQVDLNTQSPGPFSSQVTELVPDTEYVYRCAASNLHGMAWSDVRSFTPGYPRLSVDSIQIVEGDAGSTQAVFTVRLSRTYPETVSFSLATSNGTAEATSDYAALAWRGGILPGGSELQVPVTVYGDETAELDEDFFLRVYAPSNVILENGTGRCLILSDERADYLSPSVLVTDTNRMLLYVAQSTARRVDVVDLNTETVEDVIDLPQNPSGLALSPDGATLYVTAGVDSGVVHVVDAATRAVTETISVGHSPRAPVWASSNRLYLCEQFNNAVAVVDLTQGQVVDRIAVLREPFGATLTPDGATLLVANLLPHQAATAAHVAASISVIDTASGSVTQHVLLAPGSHSPREVAISSDGAYAVVAHTLARYRIPTTQILRGWINTSALGIIDLTTMTLANTVLLDDLDLGAANPWGTAFTADGESLCIAHAGTHELSVIDWPALLAKLAVETGDHSDDLTYLVGLRRRIPLPGNGPRGVSVAGTRTYTANYFSDSLAVADITSGEQFAGREITLGWQRPLDSVRQGKRHFYDATLSAQHWHSCVSCHPGVRTDGLNWDVLNDGFGNAKNTKSLLYAHETPPTTITGIRPDADTSVMSGLRFIHFVNHINAENVAINAFLRSERPIPSPHLDNGQLSPAAVRGEALYTSSGCIGCHSGPYLTDKKLHDVGTGTGREAGTKFDTPTLIEAWRTAPYLYDGRAVTIRDVLTTFNPGDRHGSTSGLSPEELDDLEAYINSL
jgi:YVTN family beta-propeller protein